MEECGRMALPIFLGRLKKKKKQGGLIQLKEDFNEKIKITTRTASRRAK